MERRLQALLEVAFPIATDSEVARGVGEGIALADDLIENTPLLKKAAGTDLRGHIRRHGIMFRLSNLCSVGDLPFAAAIVPMPHGPWHWLELRSGSFVAHVCRTIGPNTFPEDTLSRQDERLRNAPDLFKPVVADITELIPQIREFYAWLMFGVGARSRLQHLCWAMPPSDEGDWLAHRDVLQSLTATTAARVEEQKLIETPNKVIKLRFREEIEKALAEENQNKKDDEPK
ncbi:MAG: hypothetical protein AB7U62_01225 [Pseudolabrys sp.]